jgi:uncharacterized protein YkwD
MSWLVDLIIVAVIAGAAIVGIKRGAILIGLELISFVLATIVALALYHPVGSIFKGFGLSTALSHVVAFVAVWVIVEITIAIIVRLTLLRRLDRAVQVSKPNRIGGAALNVVKFTLIVTLFIIVIAGLPVAQAAKGTVTASFIARYLLSSSSPLQSWLATGLGRDLSESLNFFTVTSKPDSHERIDLGFTATGKPDPVNEAAMLRLVNQERTSRGLPALQANEPARAVARTYSVRMFAGGFFSHIDPDGKSPFDRLRAAGVPYNAAGENLALAPTLDLAHRGLMNSPGHRANILSKEYHAVGIGIIDGGVYGLMVTQVFTD